GGLVEGVVRTLCVLFFSSRRRHTRSKRDWSSDVCSSDLSYPASFLPCRCRIRNHLRKVLQSVPQVPCLSFSHGFQGLPYFQTAEIGRASCRERVDVWCGARVLQKEGGGGRSEWAREREQD